MKELVTSLQTAVSQLKKDLSANSAETSLSLNQIIKRCNDQDANINGLMRNSINDLTSKVGIIETQKINELSQRINSLVEKNLDTRLSELEQINLTNDFPKSLKSLVDAKY